MNPEARGSSFERVHARRESACQRGALGRRQAREHSFLDAVHELLGGVEGVGTCSREHRGERSPALSTGRARNQVPVNQLLQHRVHRLPCNERGSGERCGGDPRFAAEAIKARVLGHREMERSQRLFHSEVKK